MSSSERTSGSPFAKSKGRVEAVAFHPSKPLFFVATQRHVRVYHLLRQELMKKLMPSVKWISSMSIHPGGDNLILGSYDKKLCWFDLDLSTSPYKTMRSHSLAVRSVAYHPRLPLFASGADDATVHVYHERVYADLMSNPHGMYWGPAPEGGHEGAHYWKQERWDVVAARLGSEVLRVCSRWLVLVEGVGYCQTKSDKGCLWPSAVGQARTSHQ